jgi:hypothetical protein
MAASLVSASLKTLWAFGVLVVRLIEGVVRAFVRPRLEPTEIARGRSPIVSVSYSESPPPPELEECSAAALPLRESQSHPKVRHFRVKMPSGEYAYFGCTPGSGWVDVYARKRRKGETGGDFHGEYSMYGYSIAGRWSYGDGPPGAAHLREYITQLTLRGLV